MASFLNKKREGRELAEIGQLKAPGSTKLGEEPDVTGCSLSQAGVMVNSVTGFDMAPAMVKQLGVLHIRWHAGLPPHLLSSLSPLCSLAPFPGEFALSLWRSAK